MDRRAYIAGFDEPIEYGVYSPEVERPFTLDHIVAATGGSARWKRRQIPAKGGQLKAEFKGTIEDHEDPWLLPYSDPQRKKGYI